MTGIFFCTKVDEFFVGILDISKIVLELLQSFPVCLCIISTHSFRLSLVVYVVLSRFSSLIVALRALESANLFDLHCVLACVYLEELVVIGIALGIHICLAVAVNTPAHR